MTVTKKGTILKHIEFSRVMAEEIRRLAFDYVMSSSAWVKMACQKEIDRVKKERRGDV